MVDKSSIKDMIGTMDITVENIEVDDKVLVDIGRINSVEPFTHIETELTNEDRYCAYKGGLVPKVYMNAKFDIDKVQQNITSMLSNKGYKVVGFKEYSSTLLGILSVLRTGSVPESSYIIGAPNSFGKTSFTSECIMTMNKLSMRTVPFVSLSELNELMVLSERSFEEVLKLREYNSTSDERSLYVSQASPDVVKMPKQIIGRFSWSEYMNADCLFCFLTSTASRVVESKILYHIMQLRSSKGLPTICFISSSLDPYTNDRMINEYYWKEMLSYRDDVNSLDRLKHVSCFKKKKSLVDE